MTLSNLSRNWARDKTFSDATNYSLTYCTRTLKTDGHDFTFSDATNFIAHGHLRRILSASNFGRSNQDFCPSGSVLSLGIGSYCIYSLSTCTNPVSWYFNSQHENKNNCHISLLTNTWIIWSLGLLGYTSTSQHLTFLPLLPLVTHFAFILWSYCLVMQSALFWIVVWSKVTRVTMCSPWPTMTADHIWHLGSIFRPFQLE